ncbi:MAG: TetR/AcrR family transcriptional regulator [Solirubrobacteraceae bacterium]
MSSTRIPKARLAPRKLPQQARSEATVEAVLQAAAQVFERHGYAAGTTNRIAARAGVSIGSLYQYFPGKDAILLALARRHLAEGTALLQPQLERLQAGCALDEVLADVVKAMVALHASAPRLHRVLFEETPLPQTLRAELDATEDALVEVVAHSLQRQPDTAEHHLVARMIVSAIEGLTHRLVLRPAGASPDAIAIEVTTMLRGYLRQRQRTLDSRNQ